MNRLMYVFAFLIGFGTLSILYGQDPHIRPDNTWLSMKGTVISVTPETFELDYGDGIITVEMDDWDWYSETYLLLEGDRVIVNGFMDNDLFESASIEAASVYVRNLNTYFYANPADEEDYPVSVPVENISHVGSDIQITGRVESIDEREFTVDTGNREITVDTSEMLYNPLDEKGYQEVDKGDRVQVVGNLDAGLFEDRELVAESIVTLYGE